MESKQQKTKFLEINLSPLQIKFRLTLEPLFLPKTKTRALPEPVSFQVLISAEPNIGQSPVKIVCSIVIVNLHLDSLV